MSIAILNEVYNETRRLAIAGSTLANGDFRLQKLVEPLTKAGKKAPVFAKVATAVETVLSSNDKNSADALMELSTLVTAVLYTQGATGSSDKLSPIASGNFDIPATTASARTLIPVIEALTTTGSGRFEIIQDAHQRGAFKDVRLYKPSMNALDDVYPDIAEFVSKNVLPLYGKAIIADIKDSIDLQGKRGHARRLELLHKLDPEGTKSLVEEALESGSKELKVAAISCLKGSEKHLSFILEQAKARIKDVRRAAFDALSSFQGPEVEDVFVKALAGRDVDLAAYSSRTQTSTEFRNKITELSENKLQILTTEKDKTKQAKAISHFYELLESYKERDDKTSESFIANCFEKRKEMEAIEGSTVHGSTINNKIAELISKSKFHKLKKALIEEHESLSSLSLHWSMYTAIQTIPPGDVYRTYSQHYNKKLTKRSTPEAREKQDVVRNLLIKSRWHRHHYHSDPEFYDRPDFKQAEIDDNWLTDAVTQKDIHLTRALIHADHKNAVKFFADHLKARSKKTDFGSYEDITVLEALADLEHASTTEYFVAMLKKSSSGRSYAINWHLLQMMEKLPISAVSAIEAVIPDLPERSIEYLLPHLESLKAKDLKTKNPKT